MKAIQLYALVVGLVVGAALIPVAQAVTLPQGAALFETSLAARIASTDASMTLVANSVKGGSSLSGFQCFTIDEGLTTSEYVCGQVAGTNVTSMTRGIDFLNATSSVVSLEHSHRVGADVKVTDYPLIQLVRNLVNGVELFPNPLLYYAHPCSVGSASTTVCDKNYSDNLVASGASAGSNSVAGIFLLATAAQAASSTDTGVYNSVTYKLVEPAGSGTSSPGSNAGLQSVWSQNDGKLSPSWLNGTAESYVLNGTSTTINASSTLTATTSIKAASVTGSPLVLNGVPYAAPSTQGAANTTLTEDGAGNLSWASFNGMTLLSSTTTVGSMAVATSTFTAANDLHIVLYMPGLANLNPCFNFNGDVAANYAEKIYQGYSLTTALSGQTYIPLLSDGTATSTDALFFIDIKGDSSKRKQLSWTGQFSASAAQYPWTVTGFGVWNNTSSQITSFVMGAVNCGAAVPAGTIIRVYGK